MTTNFLIALQALLILGTAGQADKKQPPALDQKEIVRFFEDGGILTCRLVTLQLPQHEKGDRLVVVFGPAGLSTRNPKKLALDGVTFGKPVTIAEALGEEPASPHARAGMAAGELCKPDAPSWNAFLEAFSACMDRKRCAALRGLAKGVEPREDTTVSAAHPLTSKDILSMKR